MPDSTETINQTNQPVYGVPPSVLGELSTVEQIHLQNEVGYDPVSFGVRELEPENTTLELPHEKNEVGNTGPWNESLHLIRRALALREEIEWVAWTKGTIYPGDVGRFEPGEPLGQCLVTARFAKNYFPGSRIAEVQVKKKNGSIAGPHIVLELENDLNETCFLDLTPDQDDALGNLPRAIIELNPWHKIGYSAKDGQGPYIFVRYQSDEELATKRSKPLEHSRLLFEMMGYRYPQPHPHRIQRFAREASLNEASDLQAVKNPDLKRIKSAQSLLHNGQQLQVGLIEPTDFLPQPDWIWKASGLSSYRIIYIEQQGFIKQVLTYNRDRILMVNFRGFFKRDQLTAISNLLVPSPEKTEVLFCPNLLEDQIHSAYLTGPISGNRPGT